MRSGVVGGGRGRRRGALDLLRPRRGGRRGGVGQRVGRRRGQSVSTEAEAEARGRHGRDAAREAEETAVKTFEQGALAETLPRYAVDKAALDGGLGLLTALNTVGFAASNGEARRLVRGGGVRINDATCNDEQRVLSAGDVIEGDVIKLSAGKKRHALLAVE